MTISLNKEVIEKNGLTIGECLTLLGLINNIEKSTAIYESLLNKGLVGEEYDNGIKSGYFIVDAAKTLIDNIIVESEKSKTQKEDLKKLALKLKEIYPKGAKEGAYRQWTEGVPLIIRRLETFFKKYGHYTNEEIINATQTYVDSFNGNYRYMQILRYFIFKDKKGEEGVEPESQLLNFIENAEQTEELRVDWTSQIK